MTGRLTANRVHDVRARIMKNALVSVLRYFFVLLLLASAIGKLLDMPGFQAVVMTYQALPLSIVPMASWALALLEMGLGLWLLHGTCKVRCAFAVLLLHILYLSWLSFALLRDLQIPNCGCFGVFFPRPLTIYTLAEDSVLIVLAIALWWLLRPTQVARGR